MSADKKCSACGKSPCVCLLRALTDIRECPTCGAGGRFIKLSLAAWTAGTVILSHLGREHVDEMGWWRNCRDCHSTYVLTAHVAQARVELAVAA